MRLKLTHLWQTLLATYWFVPALMVVGALLVAFGLTAWEKQLDERDAMLFRWAYSGGPEGSREVLGVIATAVMQTAGVAFSVTIAALTLASGQFGPRLLDNFMRDRGNQVVLGTFLATFIYCLVVLRTARGGDENLAPFVPQIATSLGVLLAGASVAALIYFIHHVATAIQAPNVVEAVGQDLHRHVLATFPERISAERQRLLTHAALPADFDDRSTPVGVHRDGYLLAYDTDALLRLATERDLVIAVERRPGHFAVHGTPIARVSPADAVDDEVARRIRRAFVFGARRTHEQDVEFAADQLVELAVRALSPSVNDPFTAMNCLDRLGSALCHATRREAPLRHHFDDTGHLRVTLRRPFSFEGLVDTAFDQIRQNATGQPSVLIRMLETLAVVARCTGRDPDAVAVLTKHVEMVYRAGMENIPEDNDRRTLESRYQNALAAAEVRDDDMAHPPRVN